jgi:hypothetical protein
MGRSVFLTLLIFVFSTAGAESSCLPDFTSLQVFDQVDPVSTPDRTYILRSKRFTETYETEAVLKTRVKDGQLEMTVQFKDEFHGVSLPYNTYAVLVILNGEVLSWQDLTGQCSGPGPGIFPGQKFELNPVKLKAPGNLQISVWGRL